MADVRQRGGRQASVPSRPIQLSSCSLRSFLEISPDALLLVDQAGMIMMVNEQTEALFGYPHEELLLQPLERLLPERFRDAYIAHRKHYISAPRTRPMGVGLPFFGQRKDGTEFPADISLRPLLLDGELHVLGAIRDATSRREAEHEKKADRKKFELVSLVSHELRTPLTSIKGYVDYLLLEPDRLDPQELECLQIVQKNARQMVELINDLLDLSLLEEGKVKLRRSAFELTELMQDIVQSFQPQLRVKEQTLSTHAPTTPLLVLADRQRIEQVLTNLLSNASKFTPVGGQVMIALEPEKGQVRVSVIDTGIGMTREEQARLFTKFYRADNAAVQEAGGTGLGLVITRTLVQMHGGDVEVSSAPGEGATFSFRLPLA